jgi:dipeptidyl aminopeptidase/acylaminoacyl peptidase
MIKMKKNWTLFLFAFLYLLLLGILFFLPAKEGQGNLINPLGSKIKQKQPQPLLKYSFENLKQREYQGSEIKLEKVIKKEDKYTSWLFSFQSDGQKVTGMLNLPQKQGKLPVIVMLRGYADDTIYFTGLGTRKAAGVLAENGFITLAPDFLGFGGSDTCSADILEARFEKPITVLNLLASIKNLNQADKDKVQIWAHSNGGQIALSVLEISQKPIPTVLWAPVTEGFPKSVLQYITELDEQSLKVKKTIEDFVALYEEKNYSIDNYWNDIQASLQIHQGTSDEYIDSEWTDSFVQTLKDLGKNIIYYKYPRNDHNFSRDWDLVVQRDLQFFKTHR